VDDLLAPAFHYSSEQLANDGQACLVGCAPTISGPRLGGKMADRNVFGAFDKGQTPTIACFNKATVPLGVDLGPLIGAMQQFVDTCVAPVWGTPAKLVKSSDFISGAWALVFLDDADAANALAYHDLTPDGLPISKVFVRTIQEAKQSLSVSASHELVEMLVDPAINLYSTGPDAKALYAYESADPVEETWFPLGGFDMTNFVYPSYFEVFRRPNSTQFDYMRKVSRPYQLLSGGYQIVFKNGKVVQIFGSKAKEKRFRQEDRRQHRSEYRGLGRRNARPSAPPPGGRRKARPTTPPRRPKELLAHEPLAGA
jgi:hypothetical protein